MSESREFKIDVNINNYVNKVYTETYFLKSPKELRAFIKGKSFSIDYNSYDSSRYLPSYDGLYCPTVSNTKVFDEYDESDHQKFEEELIISKDGILPTFQFYYVRRLNSELCYFLKLAFHATLYPHDLNNNSAFNRFVLHFKFILDNIENVTEKENYQNLWLAVLTNLKNDPSVNKMGLDGKFYPLGNHLVGSINWITDRIIR